MVNDRLFSAGRILSLVALIGLLLFASCVNGVTSIECEYIDGVVLEKTLEEADDFALTYLTFEIGTGDTKVVVFPGDQTASFAIGEAYSIKICWKFTTA